MFSACDDLHFHLLLFGQAPPACHGGDVPACVRVHVIEEHAHNTRERERAKIASPSFYLLRPDGHVGLAGGLLEPGVVARYLSDRVRFQRQPNEVFSAAPCDPQPLPGNAHVD